jgi:hypothetical protein
VHSSRLRSRSALRVACDTAWPEWVAFTKQ